MCCVCTCCVVLHGGVTPNQAENGSVRSFSILGTLACRQPIPPHTTAAANRYHTGYINSVIATRIMAARPPGVQVMSNTVAIWLEKGSVRKTPTRGETRRERLPTMKARSQHVNCGHNAQHSDTHCALCLRGIVRM